MEPPIIVNDSGDVLIFASVEKAEGYLEPIDVKQSKIPIYDSQGRLLSASTVPRKRKVAFFYDLMVECVLIESMEAEPGHQPELRKLLLTFLSGVHHRLEGLEKMSLIQLVQMGLKGCGGHSGRREQVGRSRPIQLPKFTPAHP